MVKLDLGCGPNKKGEDWIGVDQYEMPGVDVVCNLGVDRWPWDDNSVDEINASHVLEHFGPVERTHVVNEIYRVLKPDCTALVTVPHWGSCRAYGDPTHQWPPMGEFFWYYLSREWREANAPHTDAKWLSWGYNCDLECFWGNFQHQGLAGRGQDFQQFAMSWFKEAIQDMQCTMKKRA